MQKPFRGLHYLSCPILLEDPLAGVFFCYNECMTKRGLGQNCFTLEDLQRYYGEYENCIYCKRPGASQFDHVIPRSRRYTNSILNASPACPACNIDRDGAIHSKESREMALGINIRRLIASGYQFTDLDKQFIAEHYDIVMPVLDKLK